ncbi:MAG: phage major capsid protein [Candidatus Borkfalkiaceae bacterium]|nr:phage major capsid protein [Christensenellaceae bacterium]
MVTVKSADKALKTLYLGVVAEQLNTEVNPLFSRIRQTTTDVWGKEIRRLAQYGINGGIGAGSEEGNLPSSAGNNYEQFVCTLKNLYGTIEISDKAVRASENDTGAFVNLLNAEMEGLLKASCFNFGRMLFGDGSGVLASVKGVSGTTVSLDGVKNVVEGMVIDFLDDVGDPLSGVSARRIVGVDRANETISVSGTALTESLVPVGSVITVQGSYGKELTGLGAIFGTSGYLYGLSRSTNKWLLPYVKNNVGNISETVLQTAIDYLEENAGSRVDFIVCSSGVKRAFQQHLATYKRNADVMDLKGGYKAISYNGIPLVSDRFCPNGTMYLLNTKDFALHQLCDWKWLEGEDGSVLKQTPGKPTYTATLVKYADLICSRPCGQAMLTGIAEA